MARLSRADLEATLHFASEVSTAAPQTDRADGWLLERISDMIGLEIASYSQHVDSSGSLLNDSEYQPGKPATEPWTPTEHEWELLKTQNPFSALARRTGDPYFSARRISDLVDMDMYSRCELFEVLDMATMPHEIQMRMPGQHGTHWTLSMVRGGRNYSVRDLLMLDALRPALIAYESQRALARMVVELQALRLAEPRRAALADAAEVAGTMLTARETEVLDLVARGASNAQIAERLWISPGTVRKHLEHIYLKLDVGSRTGALARSGRISMPPDPPLT